MIESLIERLNTVNPIREALGEKLRSAAKTNFIRNIGLYSQAFLSILYPVSQKFKEPGSFMFLGRAHKC